MNQLNEREAEICGRIQAVGYEVLRMEKRNIGVPMTDEEKLSLLDNICEQAEIADKAEERKKSIDAALKKEIDEAYATLQAMRKTAQDGVKHIEDNCIIALDKTNNVRRVFSVTTGEEIGSPEMLQDSDKQVQMPLADDKKAEGKAKEKKSEEAAPKASGAIEIGYDGNGEGTGAIEIEGEVIEAKDANAMAQTTDLELVTQIRLLEIKEGVVFVTTADKKPIVIVFEDPNDMACAQKLYEGRKMVKIKYQDIGTRNMLGIEIDEVTMPQAEGIDVTDLPPGVSIGEDEDNAPTVDDDNDPNTDPDFEELP